MSLLRADSKVLYSHVPYNSRLSAASTSTQAPVAIFVDRDGVLVEDVHYLRHVKQLCIRPGAAQALRLLQERFNVIVVTNQSGIARGLLTENDLASIHAELVRRLSAQGVVIDAFYYCPHLPEAPLPEYRQECNCRKPKPGLLLEAEREWGLDMAGSFMIGDKLRDIQAGRAAGVRGILLDAGQTPPADDCEVASDLAEAAHLILASCGEIPSRRRAR